MYVFMGFDCWAAESWRFVLILNNTTLSDELSFFVPLYYKSINLTDIS